MQNICLKVIIKGFDIADIMFLQPLMNDENWNIQIITVSLTVNIGNNLSQYYYLLILLMTVRQHDLSNLLGKIFDFLFHLI